LKSLSADWDRRAAGEIADASKKSASFPDFDRIIYLATDSVMPQPIPARLRASN
jgi:hypothetical protein